MSSALQQQLAAAVPTTTTTTTSSSVVGSGLVSLRRGEQEHRPRLRPGQEGEPEPVEKVGEAQAQSQGEELLLAPEQKSLDAQADWTMPVEWTGTVRERNVAGADVGNRLYAGKKRMFKGHKWERTRERRVGRTEMLLRDMDKRIERFKGVRSDILVFGEPFFPPPPPLKLSFLLTGLSFFLFLFFQYRAKGKPLPLARRNNVLKKTQKLPF
jgi:Mitochondrial ribosomal protein mL59